MSLLNGEIKIKYHQPKYQYFIYENNIKWTHNSFQTFKFTDIISKSKRKDVWLKVLERNWRVKV